MRTNPSGKADDNTTDFFGKPFATDPEIAKLEKELLDNHNDFAELVATSVKEMLQLMEDIGMRTVLNNDTFNWLLQEHFNPNFGKYPFDEKMPYGDIIDEKSKNRKLNGPFTEHHKIALIQFFNLLETGKLYNPIPQKDFLNLLEGTCRTYVELDRRTPMLAIGVVDKFGNTNLGALEQVQKIYQLIKDEGDMFSKKSIDTMSKLTKDSMERDGMKTFPKEFQKYTKLADLYDKAHCGYNEEYLKFFDKGREGIKPQRAKQMIKKGSVADRGGIVR